MKDLIIIGLAVVGLFTLGIDYFALEQFATIDLAQARQELWINAGILYLLLLVPPFFMINPSRREIAGEVITAGGFAILDASRYLALGYLIYMGWHLASSVFGVV